MKVYFVRHGECVSNQNGTQQTPDEPLTEKGREQARILAARFESIPVDHIITSPYARAKQTAETIAEDKSLQIRKDNLIGEFRWPSSLDGKLKKDPEAVAVRDLIEQHWAAGANASWKHSDEESFQEIRTRAAEFLNHLATLDYQYILVVSHARLLKVLFAVMIHGEDVSGKIASDFFYATSLNNTGITVATLEKNKKKDWNLITINDHAHLGDYTRQPH